MLAESTQQLILKLWELDDRGVVPWRHDPAADDFRFRTEAYVVAIARDPVRLRILRPDGAVVEEASDAELAATIWPNSRHKRFDEAVRELAGHAQEVTSGNRPLQKASLSAFHAPARSKARTSLGQSEPRAIFGAIESFDRSGGATSQVNGSSAQPPPAEEPGAPNVYSPWIVT